MKCEIIRDLLPSYVDGLTGAESNREIEAHIAECAACKGILQQMQGEMKQGKPQEKRKINPFRKFNRRLKVAIAAAVAICVCVGGMGYKAFGQGFAVNPAEVEMDAKLDGSMLYLDFTLKDGGTLRCAAIYDNTTASIDLRRAWTLPGGADASSFRWGINLDMLTMEKGERMEVQMIDGSLVEVETPGENSLTIQNGDAGTAGLMMFREGEDVVSFVVGGVEQPLEEDYTVDVHYGGQTQSYTLAELLEMAN